MSTESAAALETAATDRGTDVVDELEYEPKTGRRAVYEAFDFERAGDIVRVTNESHGDSDEEHTYTVELDDRDVPQQCTCPAFEYHCGPGEVCKHCVAVALHLPTIEDQALVTDGGQVIDAGDDGEILDSEARPEECQCWDADGGLACWPCYRAGFETPNPAEPGADEVSR